MNDFFEDAVTIKDLKVLAHSLKDKIAEHKQKKEELSKLWAKIQTVHKEMFEMMGTMGLRKASIDGLGVISQAESYSASIPAESYTECMQTIKEMQCASFIKETVNANTLSAEVRRQIEDREIVMNDNGEWIFKNGLRVPFKISCHKKVKIGKE